MTLQVLLVALCIYLYNHKKQCVFQTELGIFKLQE